MVLALAQPSFKLLKEHNQHKVETDSPGLCFLLSVEFDDAKFFTSLP